MDPILVAAPPRSGTSMISGLLYHHGVQVGEYRVNKDNPKGGFENTHIKKLVKDQLKKNGYDLNPIYTQPTTFQDDPQFRENALKFIPDPTKPWLFKEFRILMTWPLWYKYFPNSIYVLNRRNIQDNLKSMQNHRVISKRGSTRALRFWIEWARERQEEIAKYCLHVWADVDKIWAGDLSEAKKVVEACGLEFDERTTKEWIEPSLCHNWSYA